MTVLQPYADRTPAALVALPTILERANAELQSVLANLSENRVALQSATLDALQQTSDKLKQVTSTTESAATGILDALERAGTLVDDLEAADHAGDSAASQGARDCLRDEIFGMMGALQFQDITAQQLAHAASLLGETEARLCQLAQLLDPAAAGTVLPAGPDPRTFDPRATAHGAVARQALADAVFAAAA